MAEQVPDVVPRRGDVIRHGIRTHKPLSGWVTLTHSHPLFGIQKRTFSEHDHEGQRRWFLEVCPDGPEYAARQPHAKDTRLEI